MELTFNKATHGYVAEFEATADFNLHIERKTGGDIRLYQRTQGGGWDIVDDFGVLKHQGVIDYDCTALVYPKYIKIYSVSEPTYAAVVSDGEVTEIKSQSKEIEVTSNGTTVVTPDAGFAYLNKVSVKTNVPTSGGNGGGSASSVEYWDISNLSDPHRNLTIHMAACAVKGFAMGTKGVFTPVQYNMVGGIEGDVMAVAVVPSLGLDVGGIQETVEQSLITAGVDVASLPRLTEEEFYTL